MNQWIICPNCKGNCKVNYNERGMNFHVWCGQCGGTGKIKMEYR